MAARDTFARGSFSGGASRLFALVGALLLSTLACGGSSGTPGGGAGGAGGAAAGGPQGCKDVQGSCAVSYSCTEYAGYDAASAANFKANCNHPNQVWSATPCDRTATVGGCETAVQGTCAITWSYAPITTADVQTACVGQSQVFVAP